MVLQRPTSRNGLGLYLEDAWKRLQAALQPTEGVEDIYMMQQMCAYEVTYRIFSPRCDIPSADAATLKTVALGNPKFCDLFTGYERECFNYALVRVLSWGRALVHGVIRHGSNLQA